jgi:hypothetical protein
MNLSVALFDDSPAWEHMLAQEGVPCAVATQELRSEEITVLIIHHPLSEAERRRVEKYLRDGGAVLGAADYLHAVHGTVCREEQVEYLVARPGDPFDIHLLDLAIKSHIPREANCLSTEHDMFAAFAGPFGEGHAVLLPFDLAPLMFDARAVEKNFYSTRDRLPAERVSLVSKGELRHLLHSALLYLFHARRLPYVHRWYFPDGKPNLFAFRIDSDKGSREEIDTLYRVAREEDVGMTWFLDVKSHEDWLQHFAFFSGQEIGVHCYEHETYTSTAENVSNISKAKHKLNQAGVSARGFSAPFGKWNESLAQAIDEIGFDYSSEFAFAYDTLPFASSPPGKRSLPLQIPIHPICIGSLRKVGYSETQMSDYFQRVITEKLLRDEPLFFYHHPTHHHHDVMRSIFRFARDRGIENITMGEFARWWKKRLLFRLRAALHNSMLNLDWNGDESVWLRIVHPERGEAIVPAAHAIAINTLPWQKRSRATPPSDIRRMREFDPRALFGNVFSTVARKLQRRRG